LPQVRLGTINDDLRRRDFTINTLAIRLDGEHFGTIWYHRIVKPDDDNRFLISDKLQDWLAEQFTKKHQIRVETVIPRSIGRLPEEIEVFAFRSVQEILYRLKIR
jgi:hypothetical protein